MWQGQDSNPEDPIPDPMFSSGHTLPQAVLLGPKGDVQTCSWAPSLPSMVNYLIMWNTNEGETGTNMQVRSTPQAPQIGLSRPMKMMAQGSGWFWKFCAQCEDMNLGFMRKVHGSAQSAIIRAASWRGSLGIQSKFTVKGRVKSCLLWIKRIKPTQGWGLKSIKLAAIWSAGEGVFAERLGKQHPTRPWPARGSLGGRLEEVSQAELHGGAEPVLGGRTPKAEDGRNTPSSTQRHAHSFPSVKNHPVTGPSLQHTFHLNVYSCAH